MAQSAGKVMFRFRGEYNSETTYEILDIVTYDGSSYGAKKATLGNEPQDGEFWQTLASGATGGGASYGNSDTASATAAKVVTTTNGKFKLKTGASVFVKFANADTAGSCTLNVDSTGAKPILLNGVAIPANTLTNTTVFEFVYDGTSYNLTGTTGGLKAEEKTQSEYNALPNAEKQREDIIYAVPNGDGTNANTALNTAYNNTASGLDALNVQNAIDEVSAGNNKLDFETGDTTDDTADIWLPVDQIIKTNPIVIIVKKVSDMVNNVRYLFNYGSGQHLRLHNLGTEYTAELKADINSGKFRKAHVGGYLTLNGHVYYFAHPDYWYNTGDTACTTHHMLVIPAGILSSGKMNSTATTEGGYVGSDMYTGNNSNTALAEAKAIIKADFGAENILTHRELFVNAVSNGKPSSGGWYDSDIDLMNEQMVYGNALFEPANDGTIIPYKHTIDKSQILLFQLRPDLIKKRANWWLRAVLSASSFAFVSLYGYADGSSASPSFGVRPAFAVC